jgi:hypothetical protein
VPGESEAAGFDAAPDSERIWWAVVSSMTGA